MRRHPIAAAPVALVVAAGLAAAATPLAAQQADHPARAVYDRWCAGCHGVDGDGNGEAAEWMLPRPRDFTQALYQIRTTPSGQLPTDADILRIIDEGMPGTTMPGWRGKLSRQQREGLVDYLKTFSPFFASEAAPEPIDIGRAPRASDDAIAAGRELYQRLECWKCHGDGGRGDGESAPTQADDGGYPIRPADLTEPWHFNGGGSLEQIYTRLRTGLDGTPMPSFSDLIDADIVSAEDLWHLAMYVRSMSPDRPNIRDVVRAALLPSEDLPATADDEEWADVEPYYVPLAGQIVVAPRTFSPTVRGVWVQAAHDGEELVMRLSWSDPSRSPDPAWEEWRQALIRVTEPREGDHGGDQPADALTVQFPVTMPSGRALPYFLGGDERNPVYLWRWRSDRDGVQEAVSHGLDRVEPLGDSALRSAAQWSEGRWRLVVRRPLEAGGDQRLAMPRGEAIPIAFSVQDGSSGESSHRGSISSWYYLHLDQPVAASVYATPIIATLLTGLLGLGVVTRARRTRSTESTETRTVLEGSAT